MQDVIGTWNVKRKGRDRDKKRRTLLLLLLFFLLLLWKKIMKRQSKASETHTHNRGKELAEERGK